MHKTVWPPEPNSSSNKPEVVPTASREPLLPGIIAGFLLYSGTTAVAGWLAIYCGFVLTHSISPKLWAVLWPILWLSLIFLSNISPVVLYFRCKQKFRYFALGLLGGSLFGFALLLTYAYATWVDPSVTGIPPD